MSNKTPISMDRTDIQMLGILQSEGRISNSQLAERVNLSASACLRRVQHLEAAGVIVGYAAQLSLAQLRLGLQAFVRVQLAKHDAASIAEFSRRVADWEEVVACYALTGEMDYLMQVAFEDLEHFSRFLLDRLLNDAGVADVNTSFVLRTVKAPLAWPLSQLRD